MHRFWEITSVSEAQASSIYRRTIPQPIHHDSLAQLVEHNTFNVGVLGSSPRRITERFIKSQKTSENQRFSEVFVLCLYPKSAQYIAISSVQEGSRVFEARFAPSTLIVRYFSVICINCAVARLFPLGAIKGSCFCLLWYIVVYVPQHRSKMYHSVSCAYCTINIR